MQSSASTGRNPSRRRLVVIVIISLLMVLTASGTWYSAVHVPRSQRLLQAFTDAPSQATAAPIVAMLEQGDVTERDGSEMLAELVKPHLLVQPQWHVGDKLTLKLEPRFPVGLHMLYGTCEWTLHVDGVTEPDGEENSESVRVDDTIERHQGAKVVTYKLVLPRAGVFTGRVRIHWSLAPALPVSWVRMAAGRDRTLYDRARDALGLQPQWPSYKCAFELPFTIEVVEK